MWTTWSACRVPAGARATDDPDGERRCASPRGCNLGRPALAVKAVILAGGLGTRLREETEFKPKPMVEVGGRPVLWHVMKIFAHHGITDFVICIGYRGDVIKEYFLNYEAWNNDFTITLGRSHEMIFHDQHLESDWRVTVAETGAETETGGRVKMVERYLADDERFMVTYGDGVADVDVTRLLRFHEEHGRTATITAVRPLSRFGSVDLLTDGVVEQFREKPQLDDWVSAGFFVFERGIFDYLSVDTVLEKEPLESLAKESELVAYQHDGFWQPMDTYRESKLLNDLWSTGSAPWKVWPD